MAASSHFHALYEYSALPLAQNIPSIRVLDIQAAPSNDESQQNIKAELRVVNLDENPAFSALSYVWGVDAPSSIHTISCGTFEIPLSENGCSALLHLRKKLGAFTIWIDAICIDQANQDEKEHQIPWMGRIYSQAQTVYLWLGQGNAQSDRAMGYLAKAGFQDYMPSPSASACILPLLRAWLAIRWYKCTSPVKYATRTLPINPANLTLPSGSGTHSLSNSFWIRNTRLTYDYRITRIEYGRTLPVFSGESILFCLLLLLSHIMCRS